MASRVSIRLAWAIALLSTAASLAAEQRSENHVVEGASIDHGVTSAGIEFTSTQYRITLAALGEPLVSDAVLAGPSYEAQAGFVSTYSPPSEVENLVFVDSDTLAWHGARSATSYSLYRGLLAELPTTYGHCVQADILSTTTVDSATPPGGEAYLYLVAARSSLEEQGTAGFDSAATERTPTACP